MIDQKELGQRLKAAREACRLTQEEVAKRLAVSRSTLAQMELGVRTVSSLELDKLAYLYGRNISDFVAVSFRETDPFSALFRAQSDIAERPGIREIVRECMVLGRELTNIEELLGIDRNMVASTPCQLPLPQTRWEAIQQGAVLAESERRRLNRGCAPLGDMADLLETLGIRTSVVDLPDDISGITLNEPKIGLFVVINRKHDRRRRRFSHAHEYAHVLCDRDRLGFISLYSERDDLREVRANSFAAWYLMPTEGVRQFIASLGKGKASRQHQEVFDPFQDNTPEIEPLLAEARTEPGSQDILMYDVVQLAHHFGVSNQAALYRLRNLRIINDSELEKLKGQLGEVEEITRVLNLREPDAGQSRNKFYRRFLGLALEAYRRDKITHSKLVEIAGLVGVSRASIDHILDVLGLSEEKTSSVAHIS